MRVVQTGPIASWLGSGGGLGGRSGVRRRSSARERAVASLWDALLGGALAEQPSLEPALAAAVLETLSGRAAASEPVRDDGRPGGRVEGLGTARVLLARLQQLAGGSFEPVVLAHDLRHGSPPLALLLDARRASGRAPAPAPSPVGPEVHAQALAALGEAAQQRLKGAIRAAQLIATAEAAPR